MTVETTPSRAASTPLVLGVLEGDGDGPGVLFDAHYDTVRACPADWSHDPWDAYVEDGVLYGRGAVDSKGTMVAMLARIEAVVASGQPRSGPIYFMSDSDGEDGFRGATLMQDLGVIERVGTVCSAEATSNRRHRDRLPGHLDVENHRRSGRTAHPTEPERGINAIDEDGEARPGRRRPAARAPRGRLAVAQAARHRQRDPHAARAAAGRSRRAATPCSTS